MLFRKESEKRRAKRKANLIILANNSNELFAIEIATYALIRVEIPHESFYVKPLTFARALELEPLVELTEFFPDFYKASDVIFFNHRMSLTRAKRLLNTYHAPKNYPLFGIRGYSISFELLNGTHPSLAIVLPEKGPYVVSQDPMYLQFSTGIVTEEVLLANEFLAKLIHTQKDLQIDRKSLASSLGYKPRRLLAILQRPQNGYLTKAIVGMLP